MRKLKTDIPVVVRLQGMHEYIAMVILMSQGTAVKEGRKIIEESGLPLIVRDDLDEAVIKSVEIAKSR